MRQLLTGVGLLLGGALTAVCVVAVHQSWWGWLLGVTATGAMLRLLPAGLAVRTAYALGFVGMIGVVVLGRPEGDYAIASSPNGYGLVAATLAVLGYGIASIPPRRRRTP